MFTLIKKVIGGIRYYFSREKCWADMVNAGEATIYSCRGIPRNDGYPHSYIKQCEECPYLGDRQKYLGNTGCDPTSHF